MSPLSVVIIAKNEEYHIAACIESARSVSTDIIVVDSGSTDKTVAIASQKGATVIPIRWEGFGDARNKGAEKALNNWILALDCDERIGTALCNDIRKLQLTDPARIYGIKRVSFWGSKKIRFGRWGKDVVYRLYNRTHTAWNADPVHEKLVASLSVEKRLKGHLLHYTMRSLADYKKKAILYTDLSAENYFRKGKKATWVKRFLSPAFGFIQSYFLRGGFLDGAAGIEVAASTYNYIRMKYDKLHKLYQESGQER